MSNGSMIIIIFGAIILIPTAIVVMVLMMIKSNRKRKIKSYKGVTEGTIIKITRISMDSPSVIHVSYCVNGVTYKMKESAKLKSEAIKIGCIPIGQRKKFVLGAVKEGDSIKICYDENRPEKAIIAGNEGLMNT